MVSKAKRTEANSARKDIEKLFALAKEAGADQQTLADRYVHIARGLGSRNRVSLRAHNREHCRKCECWFTSATLRVRTRPTAVAYTCLQCGDVTRVPKTPTRKAQKTRT